MHVRADKDRRVIPAPRYVLSMLHILCLSVLFALASTTVQDRQEVTKKPWVYSSTKMANNLHTSCDDYENLMKIYLVPT